MSAGIMIMIDGEPVDLDEASWIQVAPCGCTSAVTIAYSDYGSGPPHLVASAEQATKRFADSVAELRQDAALGYTVKPIRRRDLDSMECNHTPRWGVPPRPTPEGSAWAIGGYWGSERTRVQHLVAAKSVEKDDFTVERDDWAATALCGVEKRRWSAKWHETAGKLECKRCLKAAAGVDR